MSFLNRISLLHGNIKNKAHALLIFCSIFGGGGDERKSGAVNSQPLQLCILSVGSRITSVSMYLWKGVLNWAT